ncbi:TPA: DsbC family protein, partial [Neisseria subflava]
LFFRKYSMSFKKTLLAIVVSAVAATACTKQNADTVVSDVNTFQTKPAEKEVQDKIKSALSKQIGNGSIVIDEINTTPSPDLYELIVKVNGDKNMVYATKDGNYIVAGSLLSSKEDKNLSAERMMQIQSQEQGFDSLPLDVAIKKVYGKGTHKIVVFSDPDCPFCKKLEHDFAKNADKLDMTVYTLMLPIEELHPGALQHARQILCSEDPNKAWYDWILDNNQTNDKQETCEKANSILEKSGEAAMKFQVQGTPTIVFENGFSQAGAESVIQIQETANKVAEQMKLNKK